MAEYIWLVPLLPLIGFIFIGLNLKRLKGINAGLIASVTVASAFLFSLLLFFTYDNQSGGRTIELFKWIEVHRLSVQFSFLVDHLSILMLLIVTGIGTSIHIYSIGYMKGDGGFNRFFSYMNLFVFFMLILVLGANYLILFIGWEGVGLCSYLLIGFWFKNHAYNDAAKKAFIMNRIGDLGFLLALFFLVREFGSVSYFEVFGKASQLPSGTTVLTLITMLLFTGAIGKSAQIPLFTWLPDAMAGPTPVSALIHAATMVTAGIYMIARSNLLFLLSPVTMATIVAVGLATALVAGSIAIYQQDIKKVLAYSTVSQLGLMFVALGTGTFAAAMFHLTTHAFFKALLFLGAGSVIHALHGEQDIRRMGGLKIKIPFTFLLFLIGTLAISGIPPFAGFFSKDAILLGAFQFGPVTGILTTAAALMTAIYMFRLLFKVFYGIPRFAENASHPVHESPASMTWTMSLLAILSIVGGFFGLPHFLGGSDRFAAYLSPVLATPIEGTRSESINLLSEWMLVIIPLILVIGLVAYSWSRFVKRANERGDALGNGWMVRWVSNKFYLDELYEAMIQKPVMWLSTFLHEKIEIGIIDKLVNQTGTLVVWIGKNIRYIQAGNVGYYLFYMVISIIIILFFNLFK
ncbi:MAG: NADH-quinone oxidoreductase subunit L [Marinilabiliales bacterium]|nr:NADH-quinone oxidoreductase subunit L [Marinilabiliales bacterium]